MTRERYTLRGVEWDKKDVRKALSGKDKGLFPGSFCKVVPDILSGFQNSVIAMHADGAGTKSSLAYIYWRETGDLSVWKGIAQDAIVMNLDDLACIGGLNNIVLSSTIGRNKNRIPGEVLKAIIDGFDEFIEKMKFFGINILSAGGETADTGDIVRTLILDSTAVCRIKKSELIVNNILPGDVIIGLASSGQTTYEDTYNSGIGSNGLTSARHELLSGIYTKKYPESYDPEIPHGLVYCGEWKLTDTIRVQRSEDNFYSRNERRGQAKPAISDISIGKLLLSPTRTYIPLLRGVIDRFRKHIHGIIHNTGGGQTKILTFAGDNHIIKDNLFEPPLIFELIKKANKTSWKEMYCVFNMGHRMEIYVPGEYADEILKMASYYQIGAKIIGKVEKSKSKKLTLYSKDRIIEF
ncbi:MAG: phosphoribosylformylglycinamidine cyclo-ligase [Bacteroidetes bacterium]|nr:phosphoribosylformylglycinamidine cyclo-ligase [Bacteroidota bacterium]